jgi:hypothetical protein
MHKIQLTNNVTCVELEQQLGLSRGAVQQISTRADGSIEVTCDQEPTTEQKAALEALLNKIISTETS